MNWDMIGHEWAVDLLREHISRQQPRHAYLITGPLGVGRRTLALRFAQALNCPLPPMLGDPCCTCQSCLQIDRMKHPDLSIVQAEQRGGTLRVDQVRELLYSLYLSPYLAKYRVALLLRFEEANQSAANALLKTLEEPPEKVILILTAISAQDLPPTIVSRCEVLNLRPVPIEIIKKGMQTREDMPDEQIRLLAHISGGRPGIALRLQQEPKFMEQRLQWLEDHARLLAARYPERFRYADMLAKDKERFHDALQIWSSLWRDTLLQLTGASTPIANLDRGEEIMSLSSQLDLKTVQSVLQVLSRTSDLLGSNINARLAAEVLMLDLPCIYSKSS